MITKPPNAIFNLPSSLAPTFLKARSRLFLATSIDCTSLSSFVLFVDLFDNMGTLIGVSKRAGLLDEKGNLPKLDGRLWPMPVPPCLDQLWAPLQ